MKLTAEQFQDLLLLACIVVIAMGCKISDLIRRARQSREDQRGFPVELLRP